MFAIKNILLKLLGSNVGKNWLKITTGNGKILIASPLCAIPANILHIPMVCMQGTSKIFPILHSAQYQQLNAYITSSCITKINNYHRGKVHLKKHSRRRRLLILGKRVSWALDITIIIKLTYQCTRFG